MTRFRKKPVVVEAFCWEGNGYHVGPPLENMTRDLIAAGRGRLVGR